MWIRNIINKKKFINAFSTGRSETVLTKFFNPSDLNTLGNVHGGVLLGLIDETSYVAALKHFYLYNKENKDFTVVLARIEQMKFLKGVYMTEIGVSRSSLAFTSTKSMLLNCQVKADCLITGSTVTKCNAKLWYVPVQISKDKKLTSINVPSLPEAETLPDYGENLKLYHSQKKARLDESSQEKFEKWKKYRNVFPDKSKPHAVAYSQTSISMFIYNFYCTPHGILRGSSLLKLMDECAGITAVRHTSMPCVTAAIDAFNFYSPGIVNNILNMHAYVVFTSKNSLKIQILCFNECAKTNETTIMCSAYFTFVTTKFGSMRQPIEPLIISNEYEEEMYKKLEQEYFKFKNNNEE